MAAAMPRGDTAGPLRWSWNLPFEVGFGLGGTSVAEVFPGRRRDREALG